MGRTDAGRESTYGAAAHTEATEVSSHGDDECAQQAHLVDSWTLAVDALVAAAPGLAL